MTWRFLKRTSFASNPKRIVLCFSQAGEVQLETFQAVTHIPASEIFLLRGANDAPPDFARPFAKLRLDDEWLLIVRVPAGEVVQTVEALRNIPAHLTVLTLPENLQDALLQADQCAIAPTPETAQETGLDKLGRLEQGLAATHDDLSEANALGHTQTASAAWLLDNMYLMRTTLADVRQDLPKDSRRRSFEQAYPEAYRLAVKLVRESGFAVNEYNIQDTLRDFLNASTLRIEELWLFPMFLRVALLEELLTLARSTTRTQHLREAAFLWANRLGASGRLGAEQLDKTLALMEADRCAALPSFLAGLGEQLQGDQHALAQVQAWTESRSEQSLLGIVRTEHAREAEDSVAAAQAFGSLRTLARLDFKKIFEAVNPVDAELQQDPAAIYPRSDFATRDQCRRVVEQIARSSRKPESEIARLAVALAVREPDPGNSHVTHFLLASGVAELERAASQKSPARVRFVRALRRHATLVYLGAITTTTICFTGVTVALAQTVGVSQERVLGVLALLALLPLSELSIQIVNALVISIFPPAILPKMDFQRGIPPEDATLVVVPMMLSSLEGIQAEVEKLEVRYLANPEANLYFSLFSDFLDSDSPTEPTDAGFLIGARKGIQALNERYPGGRFLLFHRRRTWSDSEQRWIGKERKRGKIGELSAFLSEDGSTEILHSGRLPVPIRYVITLDADTQLPPGAARRMIETAAHPLNRGEIDPETGARRKGYTIIQPRVNIALPGATATRFTRIFADTAGTDPYCRSVSDVQQDLFCEGIFHGKAIFDVRQFHAALGSRFPAETLLSHDLIEGSYVGVALASDVELLENLPLDYASFTRRQHRWIRGDWQIAPWVLGRVPGPNGTRVRNPLSLISRWRIADNMRRSLVPVTSLLLLLLGWFISDTPGVWTVVVALAVAIPGIAPLLDRWARHLQGSVDGWQGATDELTRAGVMIAFLPHQAWISVEAISRACYRSLFSRRHMLEWQTADAVENQSGAHLESTQTQILIVAFVSAALMVILNFRGQFFPTSAFLALWLASPLLLRWLNGLTPALRTQLSGADMLYLRRVARRSWRYFDDLVGDSSNWLPPDNYQVALRVEVAQRTSPTNIGLWLNSALVAYDFGFLTAEQLADRCSKTMKTLGRLERYEGHILNWYDTRTLDPLLPKYVSSADSGNFIASLWVLARGCEDVAQLPAIRVSTLKGLSDTLALLAEASGEDPSFAAPLKSARRLLRGNFHGHHLISRLRLVSHAIAQMDDLERWKTAPADERAYWASRLVQECRAWTGMIDGYLAWMETLSRPPDTFVRAAGEDIVTLRREVLQGIPSLAELAGERSTRRSSALGTILASRGVPELRPELAGWLEQVATQYAQAKARASETLRSLEGIAREASALADGMNMRFLYDEKRRLLSVGYALGGPVEFTSHYDLLASESRLASFVSVAKHDIPVEHWFALGRPRSGAGRHQLMLSWSGTMFEYLMPLLFTPSYTNSLLDQATHAAVQRQIQYGAETKTPWGISESAFSALDSHQTYQYRAFGVPALALHQEADREPVVAPYATMLALMVDPDAALMNLHRLESMGLSGPMGFYESIDFSRSSKRGGTPGVVIFAFMAHHVGMSLVALGNVLLEGSLQRRFHRDPRVQAVESLLFERVPLVRVPLGEMRPEAAPIRELVDEEPSERTWSEETSIPRLYLYSNGRYKLMITNAGSGYSRWGAVELTRWRADTTLDPWGSYLYIRDLRSDSTWTATAQPMTEATGDSFATFSADHAEFHRTVLGIETVLSVTVAPDDDAELRRLVVTNHSRRSRNLEFTSYMELAMAPHGADVAHQAFNKMFVQTEYPEEGLLVARRRPRSPEDPPVWCAHLIVNAPGATQYETDRREFLGPRGNPRLPRALQSEMKGTIGNTLDPIFSLRSAGLIPPRGRIEITFVTMAADSREAVLALAAKYRRREAVVRAFDMAWTRAQLEFRFLQIGPATAHRIMELAGHLLYPNSRLRPAPQRLLQNKLGQSALWGMEISGDLPILCVTVSDSGALPLVRDLLLAHAYWRMRGFQADLVILNQEAAGYDRPLHHQIQRQIDAFSSEAGTDRPGGIFLRQTSTLTEEQETLLITAASAVFSGSRGSFERQLRPVVESPTKDPFVPQSQAAEEPSRPLPFLELPYFNGLGGFTEGGRDYAIYLGPGAVTPAPWVNVMANSTFGTTVSESGLGDTWYGNSQQNRLTPWRNDPVNDSPGEVIYLRDEESGARWTTTAQPIREQDAHRARHGQGSTVYEHNSHAVSQELTVFVPIADAEGHGDPVKVYRLRLRNDSSRPRRLSATYFAELVLGTSREDQQIHVRTRRDEPSGALFASQVWTGPYPGTIAFAASSPRAASWSTDRRTFLGRNRSASRPEALDRARLDNRADSAMEPAFALQVSVALNPGDETEVTFLLGQTSSPEEARAIIARYQTREQVDRALTATRDWWDNKLGVLQVHTPQLSVDLLLNRWLPYQALSCRFWGRSALYQSGGAYGFRDQLQDVMAFLYLAPEIARKHILASAARQFIEGDVQHWWHPETGLGVRTLCSDDLLWLPYATARYIEVTGDAAILDERIAFLQAPVLNVAEHEQERVFIPAISEETASLWEHCQRAIQHAWRLGVHGLPLFGNGDWNDGMNHVGSEGRGESTWLAWFLCTVLDSFGRVTGDRNPELVHRWKDQAGALARAMDETGWDGEWYLRGFFDDGSPLGSRANTEARIDSLPQSWAVISGAGDPARARAAVESADRHLVCESDQTVLLFTPPFDHAEPHPGYIMGYPPGIRENGGQYTHGSLWLALAWAMLGEGSRAVRVLNMMNPVEHCRNLESVNRYRCEPYVAPADVYSAPGKEGQCGWTWYTGSAGWMYRIWIESVLGFQVRGNRLTIRPVIPPEWPGFEIVYRYRTSTYKISVEQGKDFAVEIELGGFKRDSDTIELVDDGGSHEVFVRIPRRAEQMKQLSAGSNGTGKQQPVPDDSRRSPAKLKLA